MQDLITSVGYRFNAEPLQIFYKGKTIYDILKMNVVEAAGFFASHQKISSILETLMEDNNIDFVTMQFSASKNKEDQERAEFSMQLLTEHRKRLQKPIASIVFSPDPNATEQNIIKDMLKKVGSHSTFLKILGSYPIAKLD